MPLQFAAALFTVVVAAPVPRESPELALRPARAVDAGPWMTAPGAALKGHNDQKLTRSSLDRCKAACIDRPSCKSFDYGPNNKRCYLSDSAAGQDGVPDLVDSRTYDHYALTRGPTGTKMCPELPRSHDMSESLGPAATRFGQCHSSIETVVDRITEFRDDVGVLDEMAADLKEASDVINGVLDDIKRGGLVDVAAKIPKVGKFIKMGFKIADKAADTLESVTELVANATGKFYNATGYIEKAFVGTAKVTGPVSMFLAEADEILVEAIKCAEAGCDDASQSLEDISREAYPTAEVVLQGIATTGLACHRAMNPIDEIMEVIVRASHELRKLLRPARDVLDAVVDFVTELNKEIQEFEDSLMNSNPVRCTLAIFEPLTEAFDVATCAADESVGAVFQAATIGLQTALVRLVNDMSADAIRNGVQAVIPDDLKIEIPDLEALLPAASAWLELATCTAVSKEFPEAAAAFRVAQNLELPHIVTGQSIEHMILAKAIPATRIPEPEFAYESACAEAVKALMDAPDLNVCNAFEDGEICALGSTCNTCKREATYWWSKAATCCGSEPKWADGTLCGEGSTCGACKNKSTWWASKFFTACGSEPCIKKGKLCAAGTSCNDCCSKRSEWEWMPPGYYCK